MLLKTDSLSSLPGTQRKSSRRASSLDLGSQSPRWPSDDAAFDGAALAITGRWIQRRETAHKQRKPSRQTDGSRPTTSPAAVGSSSLPPIWKPDGSGLQALADAGRAQLPQTQSIHPHQAALTMSPPTSSTQAKHHDMQHLHQAHSPLLHHGHPVCSMRWRPVTTSARASP